MPAQLKSVTYSMHQRSDRPDFYIRDQSERPAIIKPHRHDYFQIQINLGGDTVQHIGAAVRPFAHRTLTFIQPHRLHCIPHPEHGRFMVVNFTYCFLLRNLPSDALDLDDIPLDAAPELALFRFQEFMDFHMDQSDFVRIMHFLDEMHRVDRERGFGAELQLRGLLLQMLGLVCHRYRTTLSEMVNSRAERRGQKASLQRVLRYIRKNLANPDLSLADTAAAAYLSPNYLSHLLSKTVGKTFSALVFERRMRLACSRLVNSTDSVASVARCCGYKDDAYFSRRFRQFAGMSPGQYRRNPPGM